MTISDRKEQTDATTKPRVWLSVRTVAERMECSETIVRFLIREGILPAKRFLKRRLKILEADLDAYIDRAPPADTDCPAKRQKPPRRSSK